MVKREGIRKDPAVLDARPVCQVGSPAITFAGESDANSKGDVNRSGKNLQAPHFQKEEANDLCFKICVNGESEHDSIERVSVALVVYLTARRLQRLRAHIQTKGVS